MLQLDYTSLLLGFEILGSGQTFDGDLYLVEKGKKRTDAGGRSF